MQLLCRRGDHTCWTWGRGWADQCGYLGAKYGCRVVGIDITEEYCGIASKLAEQDARDLPFPDESFDVVWTQHVSMDTEGKRMNMRA